MAVAVHLVDGTSASGRVVRRSREFLTLNEHRLEAGGVMHELLSQHLLIPMRLVKAVEVKAS